jgi:MoxR-like ATPase
MSLKTKNPNLSIQRELENRELDARSGFSAQNAAALSNLKQDIADLESKQNKLLKKIHTTEQRLFALQAEHETKMQERETEVSVKEREAERKKCRLDTEWKELEREKIQIKKDARYEANLEIQNYVTARQRAEELRDKAYQDLASKEQELDEYRELSRVLAGRSATEFLDEFAHQKRKINELENHIAHNKDNQLGAENDELRKIRDEQKAQFDEVRRELTDTKTQLHRLRLGVSDKEMLEKEKRTLDKHILILSTRLNDLGGLVDDLTQSQEAEKPFPQMSWMDAASKEDWIRERKARELELPEQNVPDLKKFADEIQHRIAQAEDVELFFQLEDIRLLLSGLAMSQLHIFQGISGTGKTSLAKAFAKAMGGSCTDIAVQAGWRDRDDLLGHYNAFEKRFYEKDCLQALYKAQMEPYKNRCNIILLDEMNLSRPEQYFAEFLSALEKNDVKERLISLSESPLPNAPKLLVEGRKIRVPNNVWFVGTANHDETTNEFADKTYDRAHVMTLPRHENSFSIDKKAKAAYSLSSLDQKFEEAIKQNTEEVTELLAEITTGPLTSVLKDRFDLGWGNRLERQAEKFISVFMATGGKKEDGLDNLLANRMFRRGKVTGRYDATIDDLAAIEKALTDTWKTWESEPSCCMKLIAEDRRRKERGV